MQVKGQEEGGVSMTSEIYGIPPEVSQSTGTKVGAGSIRMDCNNFCSRQAASSSLGHIYPFPVPLMNKGMILLMFQANPLLMEVFPLQLVANNLELILAPFILAAV